METCIFKLHAADITETFLAQLSGDKSTDSQRVRNTKRGCPWPSVELLVLKPVWNNECQVATCSAAEIATSTQKILWLTIFTTPTVLRRPLLFVGANIGSTSGCTFQIFHGDENKMDRNDLFIIIHVLYFPNYFSKLFLQETNRSSVSYWWWYKRHWKFIVKSIRNCRKFISCLLSG